MRAMHVVLLSLVIGFLGGAAGGVVATRYLPTSVSGEEEPTDTEAQAEAPKPSPPPIDPGQGILKLETLPWSVVFLEGEELGDTPLEVNLPAGVHRLRFLPKRTGTEVFRDVEVKGGERTEVKLTLLDGVDTEARTPPPPSKEPPPLNPPPPPDTPEPTVVY